MIPPQPRPSSLWSGHGRRSSPESRCSWAARARRPRRIEVLIKERGRGHQPERVKKMERENDAWLSDEQLAQCAPADVADVNRMPIPTQIVSNGEYMPARQTDKQQRVQARALELASVAAKKLGVSRRHVLAGKGGMAAALPAMDEVFRPIFDLETIG